MQGSFHHNNSSQDIKRSYRRLAKQHHPDVSKNEDDGATFLKLTDAYEFLLAQIHGSSDSESPEGQWDWHDWYWKFRINRTWEKQQRGPNEASESIFEISGGQSSRPQSNGASNPQAKAAVRSQLAGLRQRAAIRSTAKATEEKTPSTEPRVSEADCDDEEDEGCVLPDPPSYVITINTIEEDEDPAFRDEGENFSSCGARLRPRRVFVATSGDRENLVGQLHGLKRRATMSSQGP